MADRPPPEDAWAYQWLTPAKLEDRVGVLLNSGVRFEDIHDLTASELADILSISLKDAAVLKRNFRLVGAPALNMHVSFVIKHVFVDNEPGNQRHIYVADTDALGAEYLRAQSSKDYRVTGSASSGAATVYARRVSDFPANSQLTVRPPMQSPLRSGEIAVSVTVASELGYANAATLDGAQRALEMEVELIRIPNIMRWGLIRDGAASEADSGVIALLPASLEVHDRLSSFGAARIVTYSGRSMIVKVKSDKSLAPNEMLLSQRLATCLGLDLQRWAKDCRCGAKHPPSPSSPHESVLAVYQCSRDERADMQSYRRPVATVVLQALDGDVCSDEALNGQANREALYSHVGLCVGDIIALNSVAPGVRATVVDILSSTQRTHVPGEVIYLDRGERSTDGVKSNSEMLRLSATMTLRPFHRDLSLRIMPVEVPFSGNPPIAEKIVRVPFASAHPGTVLAMLSLRVRTKPVLTAPVTVTISRVLTSPSAAAALIIDEHTPLHPLPCSAGAVGTLSAALQLVLHQGEERRVCVSRCFASGPFVEFLVRVESTDPNTAHHRSTPMPHPLMVGAMRQCSAARLEGCRLPASPVLHKTCYLLVGPRRGGKSFVGNALAGCVTFCTSLTSIDDNSAELQQAPISVGLVQDPARHPHQAVVVKVRGLLLPGTSDGASKVNECAKHNLSAVGEALEQRGRWGWTQVVVIVCAPEIQFDETLDALERVIPQASREKATLHVRNKYPQGQLSMPGERRLLVPFTGRSTYEPLVGPLGQALRTCTPIASIQMYRKPRQEARSAPVADQLNVEVEVRPPSHLVLFTDAVQVGECRPVHLKTADGATSRGAGVGPTTMMDIIADDDASASHCAPNPIAEENIIQRMLLHRPPAGFGAMSVREARVSVEYRPIAFPEDSSTDLIYHGPTYRLSR